MSATSATPAQVASAVSFDELLRHNEEETTRWHEWFRHNPAALEARCDAGWAKNVKDMLLHIFLVELLYAERLQGISRERISLEDFPYSTADDLFAYGARARQLFRNSIDHSSQVDWNEILTFGNGKEFSISGSRRKMFVHAMFHSVRHWAQLATALRQAGWKQDWMHDFIFTNVMR